VILFGIPEKKDESGSGAFDPNGIVQRAMRAVKKATPGLVIIGDVCLCEYTSHGHCGLIKNGEIENDATLELLAKTALTQAQAGADVIAPSDMMDGRVARLRAELDADGFSDVPIMAYSAKYASAFYGPFRVAADSAPQFGDRRSHQLDPANQREALREIALDIEEGADIVMVKPALPCLDVLALARREFNVPLAAYQVSGEFSLIEAAARQGWVDRERMIVETLVSIRRAGADIILTYFAKEAAGLLGC
jgi:porphobilinogen synthase